MNDKILNKLSEAKDSVKLVEKNFPETYEEFTDMSRLERDGIYKNIEFSIQNILDICAIIMKEEDLKVPESDEAMLNELGKAGVMDEDIIDKIQEMKGFRNLLVHRYGPLDDEIAYTDIKEGLDDFRDVFEEIRELL
ncbi:MAG: type VII toxin-antitoxin system HepT family RNase toxin [Candidatus Natronoplasma sp.]